MNPPFSFCLYFCLAGAQTPQGFNYQAVARDATGTPVASASLQVRIGLLSDTTLNTVVWEEIHNPVVTSPQGVFSIVIGAGTRQTSSAVAEFTDIDWSSSHLFIRTAIYYQSAWREMGKAKLWSVPYAMTAGDLSGALKKLEVSGQTTLPDEALFEVKNKNGQTVFAVYNEGVRIYVGDGSSKAVKGGFAIGTFDESKADTLNLLVVNKDSVRVYIYDDPLNKAVKGGFAIGGFDESKGITNDYMLISPDSIRMYIDKDGSKAVKGGFAIGGFDESKVPGQEFLRITSDSIRMYVSDDPSKAVKGGFAIGSFDESKKGPAVNFTSLTPQNYFIGHNSGSKTTTGLYNSFVGYQAGKSNSSGTANVYLGYLAGFSNQTGSNNIFIGNGVDDTSTASYTLVINNGNAPSPLIFGNLSTRRLVIYGRDAQNPNNRTFYVNGTAGGDYAWYNDSDARLKTDIATIDNPLEKVLNLRGVNFSWKEPAEGMEGRQMGFIGQEAAGVIPEVVTISNDSYSMQYAPITALLVEAVKTQQNIIEGQNIKLDRQQQLIEAQQAEFEKLRAEVEALKSMIMNGHR